MDPHEKGSAMTQPSIPWLRKGVEWVEEQAALPATKRRWDQDIYVTTQWQSLLRRGLAFEVTTLDPSFLGQVASRRQPSDCGTACCFAGYIAQEAEPGFTELPLSVQGDRAHEVAVHHLGITDNQAEELFHFDNDAADIRRVAESIAGEPL